jgi:DNA modification methylase
MKIIEKFEWGKYVSPFSDRNTAPFNWYAFKHRFGSGLVSNVFESFGLSKGNYVFDPYNGGGTTIIKAKMEGYNSIGMDISPFSVFLTNALINEYDTKKLSKTTRAISHKIKPHVVIPDVALLRKAFTEKTLKYIYSLREEINNLTCPDKSFFLLCLLSILDKTSKAKKSGGFLRITDQKMVLPNEVKEMFLKTINAYMDNFNSFKYSDAHAKAVIGDARRFPDEIKNMQFDAILTSPPYPNRHDYTRIYELELLVGFIKDNDSLKALRYNTLRSHVEAKERYRAKGYEMPEKLVKIVNILRKRELNNPQIINILTGYFEDMFLSLKEMKDVLRSGGKVGLVVSNVRFAGIMIPVDELLAEIGKHVGLNLKNIYLLRYRGNSSQQMKKFNRQPSRESIIFWEK